MRTRYLSISPTGLPKLTNCYHEAVAHAWARNGTVFFYNQSIPERLHNRQRITHAGSIVRDFSKQQKDLHVTACS